ncbi:hypothetical protein H6P81_018005 [Aristolochia fimbriata]|uniref:Uncharacterized protein n=1 Tax=Aristolochia fimbriata TaxID=158543 RepID=A0AAV7E2P3_ARIFI|nr:hypothetical protein H6P81_018005 [Aristolochia fimbriata]
MAQPSSKSKSSSRSPKSQVELISKKQSSKRHGKIRDLAHKEISKERLRKLSVSEYRALARHQNENNQSNQKSGSNQSGGNQIARQINQSDPFLSRRVDRSLAARSRIRSNPKGSKQIRFKTRKIEKDQNQRSQGRSRIKINIVDIRFHPTKDRSSRIKRSIRRIDPSRSIKMSKIQIHLRSARNQIGSEQSAKSSRQKIQIRDLDKSSGSFQHRKIRQIRR